MSQRDDDLTRAEQDFAGAVAEALAATADDFANAVTGATELVAARFSVGRIGRMWSGQVAGLVRRLLGVAETAAQAAAEDTGTELPAGWDDLPGRNDDGRALPPDIDAYVTTTTFLLRAVGDRLAEAARQELAAGIADGEGIDQLRARLRAAFARDGAQLGPAREGRIAATEASRAWNTATLAAAQAVTGPDRPLVKQWVTRHDPRVRTAHDKVDGQLRLLTEAFTVAGVHMQTPGDPTAPPELVINCRCRLAVQAAARASADDSQARPGPVFSNRRESDVLGLKSLTAAGGHSGAMIALVPTAEDAARLALDRTGAEATDELHLTLFYLGQGSDWPEDQRAALITELRNRVPDIGQAIAGRAFGANQWNGDSDEPSWVWSVGDDPGRAPDDPTLEAAHWAAVYALEDLHGQPEIPGQHTPWAAHICAAYDADPDLLPELNQRLGPVRFDRIRVAFAGETTDIPLGPEEEPTVEDTTAAITAALTTRSWSTPGDTALAFEGEETGDGRIFAAGSVYWEAGPWPLQYAEEMMGGHDGAELAGSIETVGRDGARITGTGLIYTGRSAGDDAVALLDEEAPLGVSVDLDSVDIEFVDKTVTQGADGEIILRASLAQASVMRLEDGSWAVTAETAADWTASAGALTRAAHRIQFITGPGGVIPADAVKAAFGQAGILTAAAGDPDAPDEGVVVWTENAGDFLCRITSARLRGATLVSVPAYDQARIVLDPAGATAAAQVDTTAADLAAADLSETHLAVIGFVTGSPVPVGPREVAAALGISVDAARGHLSQATTAGRIVKLARGQYVAATTEPQATALTVVADVAASADDSGLRDLVASAWTAMRDSDPLPAAWFREPTAEELPPGSGGVHYSGGRVFGWVAQAGEPHAGIPGRKVTIDNLGAIDMTHYLRARFRLDNGRTVKAGAMTMNVGHHRDGAECETAACQFDNSRTVAAIITVGMNARGMWFSGAAAPWLSEWDRSVFAACQPSYHLRQPQGGGKWQLRAVLSVPVPGHSSPLLASAVAERSNLALAASAAALADTAPDTPDTVSGHGPDMSVPGSGHRADQGGHRPDTVSGHDPDSIADAVASLLTGPVFLDQVAEAIERRNQTRAEIEALTASIAPAREEITAGTAGTATKGA